MKTPPLESSEARSKYIAENATHFTAIRFKGRGNYERHVYKTLSEAEADAKRRMVDGGRPYMLYGVLGIFDTFIRTVK
tara:strand:- start:194 stop:427 length:234 start_codon:yes stop_codon:yes gene_type:complete